MKGWDDYVSRTPEEYYTWIRDGQVEITLFKIEDLIELSLMNYNLRSRFYC